MLALGRRLDPAAPSADPEPAAGTPAWLALPPHHLVTHAAIVGMTGSGKTGLTTVLVEEALRSRIPVLLIDIKGDLPNLALAFPKLSPEEFAPWVDEDAAAREGKTGDAVAAELAERWRSGLAGWGLGPADVAAFAESVAVRVLTPGTTAGEPVHVLSSLEIRSPLWEEDEEAAREAVSASVSLLLRLVERDADPARSRDHIVLSLLAERRHLAHQPAGLAELLGDLARMPIDHVGAMSADEFLPPRERQALAQDLNALLASPTFASWRQGAPLDVGAWLRPVPGAGGPRTPAVIVSVAHLDDAERMLVLSLLLEQVLSWVRGLPGTSQLRALVVFDEVFGFLPPHPREPPTKRPLLSLLKQARAFGVGVVLATQNPMDLDYKALSNAGLWMVGRLQTDADRERVVEGLVGSDGGVGGLDAPALASMLKSLPPRRFFVRDVHESPPTALLDVRWSMSWLRGPMTRRELARLPKAPRAADGAPSPLAPTVVDPPSGGVTPRAGRGGAEVAATAPGAPPAPPGMTTWHGPAPALPTDAWTYAPHLAATVVVHARDAKLGAARTRSLRLVAPLAADGRPDMARAEEVSAEMLSATPPLDARYQPLPAALATKKGRDAAERAVRDHAYRALSLEVDAHPDLGLVRGDDEPSDAFLARCAAALERQLGVEEREAMLEHAPKLAKLEQRRARAEADLAAAQATTGGSGGAVGAAIAGVLGGRLGRRVARDHDRAQDRAERARLALGQAEQALREAVVLRNGEVAAVRAGAVPVQAGVIRKALGIKKGDVEVSALGIAWAAR